MLNELHHGLEKLQQELPHIPVKIYVSKAIFKAMFGLHDKKDEDIRPENYISRFANVPVIPSDVVKSYLVLPQNPGHSGIFAEATKGKDFCAGS